MINRERPQVSFAAEEKGHKYIELKLDPRAGRMQQPYVRYSGIYIAKETPDGFDPQSGLPRHTIQITGGFLIFKLDKERKAWFADLLDDPDGHNKEWLASHIVTKKSLEEDNKIRNNSKLKQKFFLSINGFGPGESPFIIVDAEVRHDVMNIRREMDGEIIENPTLITPLEETKAELERVKKEQAEKEAKWEEEKKALLKLNKTDKGLPKEGSPVLDNLRQAAKASEELATGSMDA